MADLLALIIIIALIFGISFQAAAMGVLGACIAIIGAPFLAEFAHWFFSPGETQQPVKVAPKPKKPDPKPMPKWLKSTLNWCALLFVTYIITQLFLVTIGAYERISEGFRQAGLPFWLLFLVPAIPFLSIFAIAIIKRMINKKHATKKK